MFELDVENKEEREVEMEDDTDEQREYQSFKRFLDGQGLEQTNEKDSNKI